MPKVDETVVEDAALSWFEGTGYTRLHGFEIAPDEPSSERESFADVVATLPGLGGLMSGRCFPFADVP